MFTSYAVIALRHHQWIEDMGWHKASPLESLGLIASEISEAMAELQMLSNNTWTPTGAFSEELADIALRTFDLLQSHDVHTPYDQIMAQAVRDSAPAQRETFPLQPLMDVVVALGPWINAARTRQNVPPEFFQHGQHFLYQVQRAAIVYNIDLFKVMSEKIEKNRKRGSRNRAV